MKIKKLKFKNFASYGNSVTEINFDESSLNLLTGDNGSGKSSVLYCILFVLTGKSVANRTLDSLVNRRNKNLETVIEIENNNSRYKIIRNLKPSKLLVYKDDILIEETNKLSLQRYINENILNNISFTMLQNLLFINVSSYTSLFKMTNSERMKFFFDLFELSFFDKIIEFSNSDMTELNDELNKLTIERYKLETKITSLKEFIRLEEEDVEVKTKNKSDELVQMVDRLNELKKELTLKKNEFENMHYSDKRLEIENKLSKLSKGISDIFNEKLNLKTSIEKIKNDKSSFLKQIKLLESGKCNVCESILTSDLHKEKIEKLKYIVKLLSDELETTDNNFLLHNDKQDRIEKQQKKLNNELSILNKSENELKIKLSMIENEIVNLNSLINIKNENNNIKKEDIVLKIDKLKSEYIETNKELTTILDSILDLEYKLNNLKTIYELFDKNSKSDKNVISYIMNIILKVVENGVNDLLLKFDKNFKIKLDNKLNILILSTDFETDYSINNLSSGEKRFLEICFLIVLITVLKEQTKQINTIFLDEIFTTLDSDTLSNTLEVLKLVSESKKLNIFIIHHGILDDSIFDNVYFVEKVNGFSEIKKM